MKTLDGVQVKEKRSTESIVWNSNTWTNRCANKWLTLRRINHNHHVFPSAQISLTLSRHSSLSTIAPGRSSGIHLVSAQSCCMLVLAGHPAFDRPCEGVHRRTSLMSSSLLLQQCPACLVCITWIVFVMGGKLLFCGVLPPGLVSVLLAAFLFSCFQAFSPCVYLASM